MCPKQTLEWICSGCSALRLSFSFGFRVLLALIFLAANTISNGSQCLKGNEWKSVSKRKCLLGCNKALKLITSSVMSEENLSCCCNTGGVVPQWLS